MGHLGHLCALQINCGPRALMCARGLRRERLSLIDARCRPPRVSSWVRDVATSVPMRKLVVVMGWGRDARGVKSIVLQLAVYDADFALYSHEAFEAEPSNHSPMSRERTDDGEPFRRSEHLRHQRQTDSNDVYARWGTRPGNGEGELGVVHCWINWRQRCALQPVRSLPTSTDTDQLPWPDSCAESVVQVTIKRVTQRRTDYV